MGKSIVDIFPHTQNVPRCCAVAITKILRNNRVKRMSNKKLVKKMKEAILVQDKPLVKTLQAELLDRLSGK